MAEIKDVHKNKALKRLSALSQSENDQVALKACIEILDRADQNPTDATISKWFIEDP